MDRIVNSQPFRILSGCGLVVGASISRVAPLPLTAAADVFALPAPGTLLLNWFVTTCAALLYLETCQWFGPRVQAVTLTGNLLGTSQRKWAWALILFLAYFTLATNVCHGGALVQAFADVLPGTTALAPLWSHGIYVFLFATILCFGTALVGQINLVLLTVMVTACVVLLILEAHGIEVGLRIGGAAIREPLHLTFTPFYSSTIGLLGVIPVLVSHFDNRIAEVRRILLIGSTLTLGLGLLWWILVGYPGSFELGALWQVQELRFTYPLLRVVGQFFSFFALASSFLCVGLGLFHILADSKALRSSIEGRVGLSLLIAVPTFLLRAFLTKAIAIPAFISATLLDVVLLGTIPAIMVWLGRYRFGLVGPYQVHGGKPLLMGVFVFGGILAVITLSSL